MAASYLLPQGIVLLTEKSAVVVAFLVKDILWVLLLQGIALPKNEGASLS